MSISVISGSVVEFILLIARAGLCAVFLVSSTEKFLDLDGSRAGLEGFGLGQALARPGAVLLPAVELAVALALTLAISAWYGALGALGLMLAFIVAIIVNLAQGRTPECHCFGQIHSEPIGWPTLARNSVLAAAAGFAAWQGPRAMDAGVDTWVLSLPAGQQGVLIAGLLVVSVALAVPLLASVSWRRRVRSVLSPGRTPAQQDTDVPAGLPPGTPAPRFRLPSLDGDTISLTDLLSEAKPVLLLFTHPRCGPCQALLPEIGRWQRDHAEALNVAIVAEGTADDNHAKSQEHGLNMVLLQRRHEVADAYRVLGTPSAVLVDASGVVASPATAGGRAIWELLARTLGVTRADAVLQLATSGLPRDMAAPPFILPRVGGGSASLDTLLAGGQPVLLLFMNPRWPPSRMLLADVAGWHRQASGRFTLAMVCRGAPSTEEDFPAHAMPVLIDASGEVLEAYQAHGTPAAVLVTREGTIGSDLMAGSDAVRGLLSALLGGSDVAGAATFMALPAGQLPHTLPPLKRGQLAPPLKLTDVDGQAVSLAGLRGSPTVLLFWNPGCSFCQGMLADVRAWEGDPPEGAPQLLVISTGDAAANREQGFRSPVVLAPGGELAAAVGAGATPAAVLLDADGRLASTVAVGSTDVLQLLGAVPLPERATGLLV